jgi:hypothetical protein
MSAPRKELYLRIGLKTVTAKRSRAAIFGADLTFALNRLDARLDSL